MISLLTLHDGQRSAGAENDNVLPARPRRSGGAMRAALLAAALWSAYTIAFRQSGLTATECAAWGVLGSLGIAWWHGTLTLPSFWQSVMGATRVTCMIMLILAGAAYCTAAMAYTGIPAALAEWVKGQNLTPGMLALSGADPMIRTPDQVQEMFMKAIPEWAEYVRLAKIPQT